MSDEKTFDPEEADVLEKPDRNEEMPPEKLVELVEPFAGMTFADIGCGTGYCFFPVVAAAQGIGMFYAVESQQAMLDQFQEKLTDRGLSIGLIQPLLTPADSLALPDGQLDRLMLCLVYHELPDRPSYAKELLRVLKPSGRLAVVDWSPLAPGEELVQGPPADHRILPSQAEEELRSAGFDLVKSVDAFEGYWAVTATRSS